MPIGPVAAITTKLDPFGGVEGYNSTVPPGTAAVVPGIGTVRVGPAMLPVATVGTQCTYHGNPDNQNRPGYNPLCASSKVVEGIPNILVEGKPIAIAGELGSLTTCGHFLYISPVLNVIASGVLG